MNMASSRLTKLKQPIAIGITALLALGMLVITLFTLYHMSEKSRELASLREEYDLVMERNRILSSQMEQLQEKNGSIESVLRDQRKKLKKAKEEQLLKAKAEVEEQLRTLEEDQEHAQFFKEKWETAKSRLARGDYSAEVTLLKSSEGIVIRLPNDFLFRPGEAILRSQRAGHARQEGGGDLSPPERFLMRLAALLNEDFHASRIRIEGHSDNVPIGGNLRKRFASNWQLSTARASSTVQFLHEHGSVDPARMTAVGKADTEPIASNDTAEGKAKNRRVDIVILLDASKEGLSEASVSLTHGQ